MPTVSVVVPTFRRPEYLRLALRSVLEQTFTDYEVLVCDNGADETTEQVVRECADPRFRYVPRAENLGILRNAVLGFQAARSEFVMLLDDDDLFYPQTVERLVRPLRSDPELGMAFGRLQLMDAAGRPLPALTAELDLSSGRAWFPPGLMRPATWVVARGGVHHSGAMMRKDLIDWAAIPAEVETAYDLFLTLKAVEDSRPVYFVDDYVVSYRIHPGSDTAQRRTPQALASCAILEDALSSGRHGDRGSLERRLAEEALFAGRGLVHQGDLRRARQLLRQSLRIDGTAGARLYAATFLPRPVVTRLVSVVATTRGSAAVVQKLRRESGRS